MGIDSMCKCDKNNICLMEKAEISSQSPKEINQIRLNLLNSQSKTKSKNRRKSQELKNSFQISGKIEQFLTPKKMDKMNDLEEDNNLLNTEKNTIQSFNPMSNRSNTPYNTNTLLVDIPFNSINIENNIDNNNSNLISNNKNNNIDILFEQISQIEDNNDLDKKLLFNRGSKNNLEELINMLNKDTKYNKDKNNDFKKIIIDYNGEQCLYNGELDKNKKINGKGLIYFVSGKKIEGNFIDGKLNGFGTYTDEFGTIYSGNFDNGILNGEGKIIKIKENIDKSINSTQKNDNLFNKITYIGNIKNFKKEGHGQEMCAEYVYEGNFHKNMKNGKGKIRFINTGDCYEGIFTNDKITGYGNYTWANKHQFIGEFIEGDMNGKGHYKWPDGSEYKGEYVNNIKEGVGEFKWSNGAIFKGKFHNGKPNGKGLIVYKGYEINAEFKNGHFVGNLKSILQNIKE